MQTSKQKDFTRHHCIALFVLLGMFMLSGCISSRYAGYTVTGKQQKSEIDNVPVWKFYCVMPNGNVRCEVESVGHYANAGVNSCTISCNNNDTWQKRQVGTRTQTISKYLLSLKSPTGEVVEENVTNKLFNEVYDGYVFPSGETNNKK